MFTNLADKQTNELQILVSELVAFVDKKIAESDNSEVEQTKEYQEFKVNNDLKAKLKVGIPLIHLLGLSFEVEKEWKLSKDIKPESFIASLRRLIHGDELQITNFNQTKQN